MSDESEIAMSIHERVHVLLRMFFEEISSHSGLFSACLQRLQLLDEAVQNFCSEFKELSPGAQSFSGESVKIIEQHLVTWNKAAERKLRKKDTDGESNINDTSSEMKQKRSEEVNDVKPAVDNIHESSNPLDQKTGGKLSEVVNLDEDFEYQVSSSPLLGKRANGSNLERTSRPDSNSSAKRPRTLSISSNTDHEMLIHGALPAASKMLDKIDELLTRLLSAQDNDNLPTAGDCRDVLQSITLQSINVTEKLVRLTHMHK